MNRRRLCLSCIFVENSTPADAFRFMHVHLFRAVRPSPQPASTPVMLYAYLFQQNRLSSMSLIQHTQSISVSILILFLPVIDFSLAKSSKDVAGDELFLESCGESASIGLDEDMLETCRSLLGLFFGL